MFVIFVIVILYFLYQWGLKPVTNKNTPVEFTITPGQTYLTIAKELKEKNLINSELVYKIYIKLKKPSNFRAGTFSLNQNMGVEKIIHALSNDSELTTEAITITFPEGKHMRGIAKIIVNKTNNKEEEIYEVLKDETYLKELINEYWFLDESILNTKLYYSLEGYLFPNTYEFKNKNVTVKEIFKTMLNETGKQLEKYQKEIEKSEYSLHEMLTLASIIELEAAGSDDRAGVAGVFYNRLKSGWSLGSDVTTYYGAKVEMSDRDLYQSEIDEVNDYNTRVTKMAGKLPVGPICNPGMDAIEASIEPKEHNNYFFVADKNGKTYFSKTNSEHEKTVAKLKKEGLWYEY
ncbi:MAG: endolytic transglycosylase MltG [Bacilli bacterium]|nr:endolytic transglycosylase MltG [Bacilli bacterium]